MDNKKDKKDITKKKKITLKNIKPKKAFEEKEKEYKSMKTKKIIEWTFLIIFILILFILLCNRTFFKDEYRTSKIKLNIPMLTFFVSDTGEELTLTTLRKSDYVKSFFEDELESMTRYNCNGGYSFFYDEDSGAAIYSISVTKKGILKSINVRYVNGNADCLCNAKKMLNAKEVKQLCENE